MFSTRGLGFLRLFQETATTFVLGVSIRLGTVVLRMLRANIDKFGVIADLAPLSVAAA